jgi:hypothetical protein
MGTFHDIQEKDFRDTGEFKRVLHSLCEKLSDAGFDVEAFHWSQPGQ